MKRLWQVSVLFFSLLAFALFLPGCKSDPYAIVELEGVATFDGQPMSNVNLIFTPKDGGKTSMAMITGTDGKFVVAYSTDRQGVKAGEIAVTVGVIDIKGYTPNEAGNKAIEQYGFQTQQPMIINISSADKNYKLDFKALNKK